MTQPTNIDYKQKALDHVRSVCPELKPPEHLSMPVRWDGHSYYWGEDMTMIADIDAVYEGEGFRLRGWGHLQDETKYQENAKFIERAINNAVTPHLEHWLRGMGSRYAISGEGDVCLWKYDLIKRWELVQSDFYNLTKDGENQSEEFYKAYCEIVGI